MSDDISAMSSSIRRPLTAMTDNIPDVEDGDSMPFDSISLSYGSRYSDSQPIVSAVNADQLYYKNAMTPKAHQKTGEIQRRLNDNYIEFDEMNMIHYFRRRRTLCGWPIWRVYTRIGSISQQREPRVTADGQEAARGAHASHKAKRLVHDVLAAKKSVGDHAQFDSEEGDITFKIGKKSKRLLFMCPSPPMQQKTR